MNWRFWEKEKPVLRLGGFRWTRRELCMGVLITGTPGSGKTLSAIIPILDQLLERPGPVSIVVFDDKGTLASVLNALVVLHGRKENHIELSLPAPGSVAAHRFNLVGDPAIPATTYARLLVEVSASQGLRQDQPFFKKTTEVAIGRAIEALRLLGFTVGLDNVLAALTEPDDTAELIDTLSRHPGGADLVRFFRGYLSQAPDQRSGVIGSVQNVLAPFATPELSSVFCGDSTFTLDDLQRGRTLCLALPQSLQSERRYLAAYLKGLVYLLMLRRFELPAAERDALPLFAFVADEVQHLVSVETQTSDAGVVDVLREAGCAFIGATQSTTSLVPVLGADHARVFALNLRTRIAFRAADEDDAVATAQFIGKHKVRRREVTTDGSKRRTSEREEEAYRVEPSELRQLAPHQAVVVHPTRGFRKRILPPMDDQGRLPSWFRRPWFSL